MKPARTIWTACLLALPLAAHSQAAPAPQPGRIPPGSTGSHTVDPGLPPVTPIPTPGTAQNPRGNLQCTDLASQSGNGGGSGPGGIMQLVSGPGLAAGGAWTPAPNGGKQRSVNFNFSFSNPEGLWRTLAKPSATTTFTVTAVRIQLVQGLTLDHPVAAELSARFLGQERSLSWSDRVTEFHGPAGRQFNSTWMVVLALSGKLQLGNGRPPADFGAQLRCQLPVQHP